MTEVHQEDDRRSVDPAIAYRVAMLSLNEATESLVLAKASLHEARSEAQQIRKEMQEGYTTTSMEIERLTNENNELRRQLAASMNRTTIDDGSDDTEQGSPHPAGNSNGQVASESGA